MMIGRASKWWLDRTAAACGLLILAPLLLGLSVLVLLTMGRPVFFRQQRPGLHEKAFILVKFRTMKMVAPGMSESQIAASDAMRLTVFGSWLRKYSLDELPQLWNVFVGDMSLVGPRPLLMSYLARYSPEQSRRHLMRPGITGLAQVSGRNQMSWESKFSYDVHYVDEWSFLLDCKILVRTVAKVLASEGVSAQGAATMPEFVGGTETHPDKMET